MNPCDLRDGNGRARTRRNGEILERAEPKPLLRDGTRHHRHELDAFLVFRDRIAGEQRPERLRDVLRREAQRPRAVLIDL